MTTSFQLSSIPKAVLGILFSYYFGVKVDSESMVDISRIVA